MTYSISAVIIAKNEENSVKKVIEESLDVLSKLTRNWEILVNDDASSDKTGQILDYYSKKYPKIKIFHQKKPLGISGGLEFLYKKASKQLVFINAADGQYTIKDLSKMLDKVDEGYDLIIGKRRTKVYYGIFRKALSYIYNILPEILFGVKLYDAGSNKVYKMEVLKKTTPISKSVFSEAERIIRAQLLGFKIVSVPISYFPREGGKATGAHLKSIIGAMIDMLKLRYYLK